MPSRLLAILALWCLSAAGCASTVAGTAKLARPLPLTTEADLPTLLLSATDVGAAMSSPDLAVTRDINRTWNDNSRFSDINCLAVAGAAQQAVYADSGWTAVHSQILREPPTAPAWSHYAVQAVVLFPTARIAEDFFATSQGSWAHCSNRELTYPQPLGPNQVWSVGQTSTDHDVLTLSRVERSPEQWACQRALSVHGNLIVDVEACSLAGPTGAAAAIACQITGRLPVT